MSTPIRPADTRPYRAMSARGPQIAVVVTELDGGKIEQKLRQVGWLGQTGAFYSLDEHPAATEPGSYSPLWFIVDSARLVEDEKAKG